MKYLRLYFLLLMSLVCVQCTSMDASVQYPDQTKKDLGIGKVAVLLFDIDDAKWEDEFTDAIALYISKYLPMKVIERDQLSKVVNEQSFSKTGIIDTQTAVRIGKVLGVDALVFGRGSALRKYDSKGNLIPNLVDTVSLKVVHIESGHVIINARKKPGADWNPINLAKFVLSFGFIWSREDILVESNQYDFVAENLVRKIHEELR